MTDQYIESLMRLNVGYILKCENIMLRNLDNGTFAVSRNLEGNGDCWEEEFESVDLSDAVILFLSEISD